PAVTHTGGSPGPPGLSSSSDAGRRYAEESPGLRRPASPKTAAGLVTRRKVHGTSRTAGNAATIAALMTVLRPSQRQAAAAPAAGTHPNSRTSTASQGFPPSTVARAATTATYGGALAAEPMPTSW